MANSYEFLPVPGQSPVQEEYASPELLYSTAKFTQKGATVAGGQGVIPLGTVLAYNTATHKYVPYAAAGANGAGTPVGVLRRSIDTTRGDQVTNIVISGICKLELMHGLDAGAVTALNGRSDTNMGTFSF